MEESNTCVHLDRIPDATTNYNLIVAYYVTCIAEGYKRKATEANCHCCRSSNRIHACLECAFFGCFNGEGGRMNHMKDHAVRNEHFCAVNINHGCLFCFACGDYIYNEDFENILDDYNLEANKLIDYPRILPWKPKTKEIELIKDKVKRIADDLYIGLRGVENFGNSCFLNCAIQVLMHCPALRDFFLSDKHRCCVPANAPCLTCEMFVLFQQFYSGVSTRYDASKRLVRVLMRFCRLIPGKESDSCELYEEIVAGMHASYRPEPKDQLDNCDCVIHQMFYGTVETLKVCSTCRTESLLPLDHFTNIILHPDGVTDSLVNCLNRKYLKPNLLDQHTCQQQHCQKKDTAYLYNTIIKLPAVICFQVNFRYKGGTKASKKLNIHLSFNETIDMSPYLKSKYSSNGKDSCASLGIDNRYSLFAVLIHKGDVANGHYIVYIKNRGNRWYESDDGQIYSRNIVEVLHCQPYALFYSKLL